MLNWASYMREALRQYYSEEEIETILEDMKEQMTFSI